MSLKNSALQMTIEVSYPTRRMHFLNDETYSMTMNLKSKKLSCAALVIDYVKMYEKEENLTVEPKCNNVMNENVKFELDEKTCKVIPKKQTDTKSELKNILIGKDLIILKNIFNMFLFYKVQTLLTYQNLQNLDFQKPKILFLEFVFQMVNIYFFKLQK